MRFTLIGDRLWRPLTERGAPCRSIVFTFINGNPLIDDVVVDLSDLDAAKAEGVLMSE
jgi:hypothetical protein